MMKKKNNKVFILLVGFIIASVGLIIVMFIENNQNINVMDDEVNTGMGKEIEEDSNKQSDMIMVNIPSEIYISSKDYSGRAEITNTEEHQYAISVNLLLGETGESIYQSPILSPGEGVEVITLTTPIKLGTYNITAVFTVYTKDTMEEVTTVALEVVLYVIDML